MSKPVTIALILSLLTLASCGDSQPDNRWAWENIDTSAEKVAERAELVRELIDKGVILRVSLNRAQPQLIVLGTYYHLNIDQKDDIGTLTYLWCADQNDGFPASVDDPLLIVDGVSGNTVGQFTQRNLTQLGAEH